MNEDGAEALLAAADRRVTEGFNIIHRELEGLREPGDRLDAKIDRIAEPSHQMRAGHRELPGGMRSLHPAVWALAGCTLVILAAIVFAATLRLALLGG